MVREPEETEFETETQIARRLWSDNELRGLDSFEDALNAIGPNVVDSVDAIGSGFVVLEDKDRLLKVPFLALEWRFNPGKFTNDLGEITNFVSVTVITRHNERWILNDGSTGIAQQLHDYSERTGSYGGVMFKNGLRVSRDYPVTTPDGREIKGTTYYLA